MFSTFGKKWVVPGDRESKYLQIMSDIRTYDLGSLSNWWDLMVKFGFNFTKIRSYGWYEIWLIMYWRQLPASYLRHYLYQIKFRICWRPFIFHACPKIFKSCAQCSKKWRKFEKSQTSPVYWILFELRLCSDKADQYIICRL